jgi:hypothetical protein
MTVSREGACVSGFSQVGVLPTIQPPPLGVVRVSGPNEQAMSPIGERHARTQQVSSDFRPLAFPSTRPVKIPAHGRHAAHIHVCQFLGSETPLPRADSTIALACDQSQKLGLELRVKRPYGQDFRCQCPKSR